MVPPREKEHNERWQNHPDSSDCYPKAALSANTFDKIEAEPEPNLALYSWLNLMERRFGFVTQQAIGRGSFDSIAQLERAITRFLERRNQKRAAIHLDQETCEIKHRIQAAKLISDTRR